MTHPAALLPGAGRQTEAVQVQDFKGPASRAHANAWHGGIRCKLPRSADLPSTLVTVMAHASDDLAPVLWTS